MWRRDGDDALARHETQAPVREEPTRVVLVGVEDRLPRRRAERAGAAYLGSGERVQQRRFAGAGRAEQQHEERGLDVGGARSDETLDVIAQPARPLARGRVSGLECQSAFRELSEPAAAADEIGRARVGLRHGAVQLFARRRRGGLPPDAR